MIYKLELELYMADWLLRQKHEEKGDKEIAVDVDFSFCLVLILKVNYVQLLNNRILFICKQKVLPVQHGFLMCTRKCYTLQINTLVLYNTMSV